jgi:hypothetical protein
MARWLLIITAFLAGFLGGLLALSGLFFKPVPITALLGISAGLALLGGGLIAMTRADVPLQIARRRRRNNVVEIWRARLARDMSNICAPEHDN